MSHQLTFAVHVVVTCGLLAVPTSPARSQSSGLQAVGPVCYKLDFDQAIAEIKSADPTLADMIDTLTAHGESPTIVRYGGGANPKTLSKRSTGVSAVQWDPDVGVQLPNRFHDNVCTDGYAEFVHELAHAYLFVRHSVDFTSDASTNFVSRFEISATQMENTYRLAKGLCPRLVYGSRFLPDWALPPPDKWCDIFAVRPCQQRPVSRCTALGGGCAGPLCTCPAPGFLGSWLCCNGHCILESDWQNCGSCGNVCKPPHFCGRNSSGKATCCLPGDPTCHS